jgi:hypothetical protein
MIAQVSAIVEFVTMSLQTAMYGASRTGAGAVRGVDRVSAGAESIDSPG